MREDLDAAAAALAEYAADRLWVWSHLGHFMEFATLGIAQAALPGTPEQGRRRLGTRSVVWSLSFLGN